MGEKNITRGESRCEAGAADELMIARAKRQNATTATAVAEQGWGAVENVLNELIHHYPGCRSFKYRAWMHQHLSTSDVNTLASILTIAIERLASKGNDE